MPGAMSEEHLQSMQRRGIFMGRERSNSYDSTAPPTGSREVAHLRLRGRGRIDCSKWRNPVVHISITRYKNYMKARYINAVNAAKLLNRVKQLPAELILSVLEHLVAGVYGNRSIWVVRQGQLDILALNLVPKIPSNRPMRESLPPAPRWPDNFSETGMVEDALLHKIVLQHRFERIIDNGGHITYPICPAMPAKHLKQLRHLDLLLLVPNQSTVYSLPLFQLPAALQGLNVLPGLKSFSLTLRLTSSTHLVQQLPRSGVLGEVEAVSRLIKAISALRIGQKLIGVGRWTDDDDVRKMSGDVIDADPTYGMEKGAGEGEEGGRESDSTVARQILHHAGSHIRL